MGIASAAKSAPVKSDGSWITPGDYLLQITQLKEHNPPGKLAFISEFVVLRSSGPEAIEPGRDASNYVDCLKFEGSLAGEVLKFYAALDGSDPEDISDEIINAGVSEEQPFAGMLVRAKAWTHVTNKGKEITKVKWIQATDEDNAQLDELRKSAGVA